MYLYFQFLYARLSACLARKSLQDNKLCVVDKVKWILFAHFPYRRLHPDQVPSSGFLKLVDNKLLDLFESRLNNSFPGYQLPWRKNNFWIIVTMTSFFCALCKKIRKNFCSLVTSGMVTLSKFLKECHLQYIFAVHV